MTTSTTTATADTGVGSGDGGVLLADALSVNALFSLATGAALTLGAPWLDGIVGVPAAVLAALGLGLLGFAAVIVAGLARPPTLRPTAIAVVTADVAWVLGAAVVVPTGLLSRSGDVLLVVVTAVVASVAVAQAVGLRRARGAARPGVRPVRLTGHRDVDADVDEAWSVVADAAGYAAHAPGIAATTTDGEVADGMRRRCRDDGGRTWSETCRVLSPGRAYRMAVDTTTYPLRHRLVFDALAMTWHVAPTATGSRIELSFDGGTKLGLLGRAALAALTKGAPHETVLDGYAARLTGAAAPR